MTQEEQEELADVIVEAMADVVKPLRERIAVLEKQLGITPRATDPVNDLLTDTLGGVA